MEPIVELPLPTEARLASLSIVGLSEAKAAVRARYPDADLVLFGSRARGEGREESDMDLCVLIDKADRRVIDIAAELHLVLSTILDTALDLVVFERMTFAARKSAGASFELAIHRDGITV